MTKDMVSKLALGVLVLQFWALNIHALRRLEGRFLKGKPVTGLYFLVAVLRKTNSSEYLVDYSYRKGKMCRPSLLPLHGLGKYHQSQLHFHERIRGSSD